MAENNSRDEKEVRRRKQSKKMTKIISKAWGLPNAEIFQESSKRSDADNVFDLSTLGKYLDEGNYKHGRSGWERFARDVGGVYNHIIRRKTKQSKTAKEHLAAVKQMLSKIDESLGNIASSHFPQESPLGERERAAKKRKVSLNDMNHVPKKKMNKDTRKKPDDLTLGEREEIAIEDLFSYIEESGGNRQQVSSFRARVTKRSDGRYDTNFYNSEGRRFRSMIDVARFLGLVRSKQQPNKRATTKKPTTLRDAETEKRKLRKELDKLLKSHQKATKALDDFRNEQDESRYPVDDDLLMEETEHGTGQVTVTQVQSAASRNPDIDGYPFIPSHCIPDLLMVWDFLCTFGRVLSLNPIDFDGFVTSLTYQAPSSSSNEGNNWPGQLRDQPPVYLAEAHIGLLKLLLLDKASDDWWWSILETDETLQNDEAELAGPLDKRMPVIKVDIAALLAYDEDPLITASWLQALEEVRNIKTNSGGQIKQAVKSALVVVANKWVKAYLKKSLSNWKPNSAGFTKRAVVWLIDRVRDARPDLWGRNVRKGVVFEHRARVVEEVSQLMAKMDDSGDVIAIEDLVSDGESDDEDEEYDESGDEAANGVGEESLNSHTQAKVVENADELPVTTVVPNKPPPSLVDLLLPPAKPMPHADLLNPFTWPALAGASACRVIHRYKRCRNEVDDKLRDFRELPPMSVGERRTRESETVTRVLSECFATEGGWNPVEKAVEHLCEGGSYLALSPVQRLCLLKLLVESAYDTAKIYEVVDGNFKARIGAVKALEAEERRAKREAKEEAAKSEIAAREKLVSEAVANYFEEKRNELRKLNETTNEYTDQFIDELTEEDLIEFNEDNKAEYGALPKPQSFSKSDVTKMVKRMQEEAAFDTHALIVVSMDDVASRDAAEIESMEKKLASLQEYEYADRETSRKIERLKRDIEHFHTIEDSLPQVRETAVEILNEAIQDGTMKSLRSAIRVAKQAKLMGRDEDSGGVWALDLLRDVALELKQAEGRKRLIEAQKDLVAKRNKCFTRTEPVGRDRFRNRFWHLGGEHDSRVWVEADFLLEDASKTKPERKEGHVDLYMTGSEMKVCAEEREEDLVNPDFPEDEVKRFQKFCRQEFHTAGFSSALTKRHWGCQASESSVRGLMKTLDSRGQRERELKEKLKETLELTRHQPGTEATGDIHSVDEQKMDADEDIQTSGDSDLLMSAMQSSGLENASLPQHLSTAIGCRVRLREEIDANKDVILANYPTGTVSGWKWTNDQPVEDFSEDVPMESDTERRERYPTWKVVLDGGGYRLLDGHQLVFSISRFRKWKSEETGYFESDAAFLGYRNSHGRYCGRAADAPYAATVESLARLMVRREQELYTPLKSRTFDNAWGGKSGSRNAWIASMKESCFDLPTASRALLTLEEAFHQLTGGVSNGSFEDQTARNTLDDKAQRFEIELESIEKKITGLWNSKQSRAIYREIVSNARTPGTLALALDLVCRNCHAYLEANKLPEVKDLGMSTGTRRTTRRMNAWQQANQDWY